MGRAPRPASAADFVASLRDPVLSAPKEQPYDRLKESLLQHYLPLRGQLLSARHSIGEKKPSPYPGFGDRVSVVFRVLSLE